MGEPRQGIVFRGMKTGDYVSAWIHPSELHVRQFEWKDLVCFMGDDDAAEYCVVAPCTYSWRWYRAAGSPTGNYIEVLTWEVQFIQWARWNNDSQRMHVVSQPWHDGV